ncbi:Cof-type HAD-IIB family hydrolase [Solibacillus sp. FSL H8-0538]|uniref:Cof-type HAD-IIB family hydrolase n=1 Tax=Solibacillus sp. FSL H8-0538 TaxID=2921400 RepID=UPI0030F81634
MKNILFFDVDGTLFNSQKKLPVSAKEAIFKARANGHEIAIATGRAPFMIKQLLKELEIDTYVTFNGQYVVYKGEVIFTDSIPNVELEEIIAYGAERNHPVVFLDDRKMIASVEGNVAIQESLDTLRYPYPEMDAQFYLNSAVYQTLLFIEEHEQQQYETRFPNVEFVRWHAKSCDMLPKGGSKARGIEKILQHISVPIEQVMAFGDGLNDVEMLRAVGIGVAMGNGHSKAKEAADLIAGHVDEDGLYKIMKKLMLF